MIKIVPDPETNHHREGSGHEELRRHSQSKVHPKSPRVLRIDDSPVVGYAHNIAVQRAGGRAV